jgi:hypothetical protein
MSCFITLNLRKFVQQFYLWALNAVKLFLDADPDACRGYADVRVPEKVALCEA